MDKAMEATHAYVARRPCGCAIAVAVDEPTRGTEALLWLMPMAARGCFLERVTVAKARKLRRSCSKCDDVDLPQQAVDLTALREKAERGDASPYDTLALIHKLEGAADTIRAIMGAKLKTEVRKDENGIHVKYLFPERTTSWDLGAMFWHLSNLFDSWSIKATGKRATSVPTIDLCKIRPLTDDGRHDITFTISPSDPGYAVVEAGTGNAEPAPAAGGEA
jgi:hypothetical protein